MRLASTSDLSVDVEGIGRFVFARRNMRDIYRIRGEYNALTSVNVDAEGNYADIGALAFVTIEALLVKAPEGFSLDNLDPVARDDCEDQIMKVFIALREKEASFRPKPAPDQQEIGQGDGPQLRAGVPPAVQPATD